MTGRALVIGGGIGGLAAAIALRRAGWEAAVYERADGLVAAGAGLALWTNALAALDRIGVGERVRAAGVPSAGGRVWDRLARHLFGRLQPRQMAWFTDVAL